MAERNRRRDTRNKNTEPELLGWHQAKGGNMGFQASPASEAEPVAWDGSGHRLTLGMTGSGKAVNSAIPELLTHSGTGNAVVFDCKGELFHVTHRWRRDVLGHQIVLLDPFNVVDSQPIKDGFNPLDFSQLTDGDNYTTASMLASMFCGVSPKSALSRNSTNDDFWQEQATALLTGLIGAAIEHKLGLTPSIPAIRALIKCHDPVYKSAVGLDTCPPSKPFYEEIASFLQTVEVTRSGILSTLTSHFRGMAGEGLDRALEKSTFSLKGFISGDLKATIYVVVPPEHISSSSRFLRLVFGTLLSALYTRRYIPWQKTLVQIDECAVLAGFDPIRTGITLFRGSGVILHTLFQDIDQIVTNYTDAKTLINNTSLIRILGVGNYWQATALAEFFGFSPRDLIELAVNEQMVILNGRPIRCRRVNYLQDAMYRERFDPNPRYMNFNDDRQNQKLNFNKRKVSR